MTSPILTPEQAREIARHHADDICESVARTLDVYLECRRPRLLEYVEDELAHTLENLRLPEEDGA